MSLEIEVHPATSGSTKPNSTDNTHNPWTQEQGLRLRRAAALRLPPLETGSRDPFTEKQPLSEGQARALCRELYTQGFDVDYLAQRYGVTPLRAVTA